VSNELDREIAKTVEITIQVEDINGILNTPQTDIGESPL